MDISTDLIIPIMFKEREEVMAAVGKNLPLLMNKAKIKKIIALEIKGHIMVVELEVKNISRATAQINNIKKSSTMVRDPMVEIKEPTTKVQVNTMRNRNSKVTKIHLTIIIIIREAAADNLLKLKTITLIKEGVVHILRSLIKTPTRAPAEGKRVELRNIKHKEFPYKI